MKLLIHQISAFIATLSIVTFLSTTIVSELFLNTEAISQVKSMIVMPGLFILIPAIALTGATGFLMTKSTAGGLIRNKRKRMPFIAVNGVLVLIPCAIFLDRWASAGVFDASFYLVQTIELIAGAVNLTLMATNIRDGLRMSGRFRKTAVLSNNSLGLNRGGKNGVFGSKILPHSGCCGDGGRADRRVAH